MIGVDFIAPGVDLPLTPEKTAKVLGLFFNETATTMVEALYPSKNFDNEESRVAYLLRDFFFLCPNRETARAISDQGLPVWLYQFTQKVCSMCIGCNLLIVYSVSQLGLLLLLRCPIGLITIRSGTITAANFHWFLPMR